MEVDPLFDYVERIPGGAIITTSVDKLRHAIRDHKITDNVLEWSREKLTWKLNGIPVCSSTQGVPQVPMYLNINSSLYQDVDGSVLPAELEVDWVRCYQPVGK